MFILLKKVLMLFFDPFIVMLFYFGINILNKFIADIIAILY